MGTKGINVLLLQNMIILEKSEGEANFFWDFTSYGALCQAISACHALPALAGDLVGI